MTITKEKNYPPLLLAAHGQQSKSKWPASMRHWSAQGTQADYYDQDPYVSKAVGIAAIHFRATLMND